MRANVMSDRLVFPHVSSAIVMAWPEYIADVARRIAAMPDTEVVYAAGSQVVVVLEAANAGEISAG